VPELPEVEATARLLSAALAGARIESVLAPGINALRTVDPPLDALVGRTIEGVTRRGKVLVVEISGGLALAMHMMSAGRVQLYERVAGPRDRTSRLLVRVLTPAGESLELRLREFGKRQAAWVKLLTDEALEEAEAIAGLGPEAWPDTPDLREMLASPRPLHSLLRDRRVIAGIGRAWADEILWQALLSPFKRGADLTEAQSTRLREAINEKLGGALAFYERELSLPIPDKLPMPLEVHGREGEACPRCGQELRAVHFEDYVIAYCPTCQTEGRVLKDRRMSRILR
jgi:formamidopyrimidine-DNA glycosylase